MGIFGKLLLNGKTKKKEESTHDARNNLDRKLVEEIRRKQQQQRLTRKNIKDSLTKYDK